jgi:hypothetical protein
LSLASHSGSVAIDLHGFPSLKLKPAQYLRQVFAGRDMLFDELRYRHVMLMAEVGGRNPHDAFW